MKKILFILFSLFLVSQLFANDVVSNIHTDLEWQYYEQYGYMYKKENLNLSTFTIVPTGDAKYPFGWKHEYDSVFERNCYEEPWNYIGKTESDEIEAYLREEDGKVYLSLNSFKVPEGEPYGINWWDMCQKEISYFNPLTCRIEPYEIKPDDEVVLYDFSAKVGDRYRTLLFGSVLCDVTVIIIEEVDNLYINNDSPSIVIEVIPEFYEKWCDSEILRDIYSIKYTQGIGNIYMGNYIYLFTEPSAYPDNGYNAIFTVNNIYKDGSIIYKGKDFQDSLNAIGDIKNDSSNSIGDSMDNKIYDLHGREVTTTLPGSIYIQNGKKFVAR